MNQYDLIVIGAGISGLGLAHHGVQAGWRSLVLEADDRVGGCLNSLRPEGFWLEVGAHTCFNSYGHLIRILEEVKALDRIQGRQKLGYKLWTESGLKSVFSRLNLPELAFNLPRLFVTDKSGLSVKEYYSRIAGQGNYQRLLGHAFNAVTCQEAGDFPADMLFRRKPRRKDLPKHYTAPGGLQTLAEAIAGQPGMEIRQGQRVSGVRREGDGFAVAIEGEEELMARRVALAVPADIGAALLRNGLPAVADVLKRVRVVSVESLAVVVRQAEVGLPPIAGLIGPDQPFYSVVTRDVVPDPELRAFTFHFRPQTLGPEEREQVVTQVLGVPRERMRLVYHHRNRLPALRVGHTDIVAELDRRLASEPGLAVTGNYFLGVSIEDCLTRSREEFERLAV